MRITEAQLRRIIREELENLTTGGMSILPQGVTPELYAEYIAKFWGIERLQKNALSDDVTPFIIADHDKIISTITANGKISEEEARQYIKLAEICINAEEFPYNQDSIMLFISNKFKIPISKLDRYIDTASFGQDNPKLFFMAMVEPYKTSDQNLIFYFKTKGNKISKENLDKAIDFMNSMMAFTEEKQLSKAELANIKRLMRSDLSGLMQAAFLYSMS